MKEIEIKSGVTLTKLTFGEEKIQTDDLTSIVMGQTKIGQMTTPAVVPNNTGAAAAQPPANNPAPSSTAPSKLQELKGNLNVQGTYSQIVDFFNQLYQLDRIVNVKKWDIATSGGEMNGFQPLAAKLQRENEQQLLLQAKMEFAIYAAKQYSGKLADLPPLSVPLPEAPKVPILTDQQYYDLLKSAAGQ
jgi:DNA polymerase elongation subunit (family B)